ncbi:MAG: DNA alkylation repair protein [Desulfobacterales bacterium]|nr:MAG: DNA alkylation repair protein [Desulfobacterales bacterium]
MMVNEIKKRLRKLGDKERAAVSQRFFKTGPGEYGEGDIFAGITVPELRKLARQYRHMTLNDTTELLQSPIHEERLLALLILIHKFSTGAAPLKKQIFDLYLNNTRYINNWDLVDVSAQYIVGAYLVQKTKKVLYRLAKSEDFWERRIAIMSTFHFIRQNDFSETLKIARVLIADREDLIHKAVGWMLREIGKRDMQTEEEFLLKYYKQMPRTMLRYAIEKFPKVRRRLYLTGKI